MKGALTLVLGLAIIGSLCMWVAHQKGEEAFSLGPMVSGAGGLFLLFLIIKYAVRVGVRGTKSPLSSSPAYKPIGQSLNMPSLEDYDGPGRYRVEGVDRNTRLDTTTYVQATSRANAQAKVELEGILVTQVTAE